MSDQNTQLEDPNGRQHILTDLRVRINLSHDTMGEMSVHSENMSDGGVFIVEEGQQLPGMGEIVWIQVQGLPVEASRLKAKIVRIDHNGIGLKFIDSK